MTASVVADGWREVEIGELNAVVTSGSRGWGKYYSEAGDLFIRITNLSRKNINLDFSNSKFVRLPSEEREGLRTSVQNGDVLISITADIGIAGIVDDGVPKPAYINQHIASVRFPVGAANGRFVAYYLASEGPQKSFRAMTDTGAKAGMSLGTVRKIRFQCPPLAEQQRIASALKDIDDLIASLDALIAKKRDIKQAAMQQLLTGKARLPGFEREWQEYSFGTLFTFLKNGSNSRSDLSSEGEVSYVHYGDIHACASPRMSAITLPKIAASKVSSLPRVRNGDLIFADASEDYAGVGKSVEMVDCDDREVVAGLHTILARGNDDLLADGFKGYLQMLPDVKAALIRIANGISVYGISKTGIRPIQIFLPGKDEQSAIASVLIDMDAEIDEVATKRAKAVSIKDGMMQQLLTGRIRLV